MATDLLDKLHHGRTAKAHAMSRAPDALDLSIIEQLRVDGRLPNKLLAERLSVSEATVAARLRALSDQGTMRVYFARPLSDGEVANGGADGTT